MQLYCHSSLLSVSIWLDVCYPVPNHSYDNHNAMFINAKNMPQEYLLNNLSSVLFLLYQFLDCSLKNSLTEVSYVIS